MRVDIQKISSLARDERGVELVEFAMTSWLLIVVLIGSFECLFAMYAYQFTTYAAQQGARFAMVRGDTWSQNGGPSCSTTAPPSFTMPYACTAASGDVQNYVESLATGGINQGKVVASTVWPGQTPDGTACTPSNNKGCLVKVTVSYTFNAVPFLDMTAMSMSGTSEKVILQ
jgi:Flp pilus assembly protein TadG